MRRCATRVGSLGELLPVAVVEPDGLMVTTDGRYVRVIECDRVPNTITADPAALARIEAAFAQLCQTIGDRQSLMILAQTDPVPITDALASDHQATQVAAAHDHAAGQPDLARARRRLLAATEQTVGAAADAEQPAVAMRWWVVVPYRPVVEDPAEQLRRLAAGAKGRRPWAVHRDAAVESLRYCGQVDAALRRAGIDTWPLDGTQTLALVWERLHPAAEHHPRLSAPRRRLPDHHRHRPDAAARVRHEVLEAVCGDPPASLDLSEHPAWIRHRDGTLGGDHPSRHPAGGDRPLVASVPAGVPAAGHAGGAHLGRGARPGALAAPATLAAAARRGALQGPPRPARRLRRGGRAGRGRDGRRRARRTDRRDRLRRRGLLRHPRPRRRPRII